MKKITAEIIKEAFLELVLCMEAIFLIHEVKNDVVEEVVRTMEEIYGNTIKSLKEVHGSDLDEQGTLNGSTSTYPSVERFISLLREDSVGTY